MTKNAELIIVKFTIVTNIQYKYTIVKFYDIHNRGGFNAFLIENHCCCYGFLTSAGCLR